MEFHIFTIGLTVIIYLILRYRNQNNELYALTVPILLYGYRYFGTTLLIGAGNENESVISTIGLMTAPYPSSSN